MSWTQQPYFTVTIILYKDSDIVYRVYSRQCVFDYVDTEIS